MLISDHRVGQEAGAFHTCSSVGSINWPWPVSICNKGERGNCEVAVLSGVIYQKCESVSAAPPLFEKLQSI